MDPSLRLRFLDGIATVTGLRLETGSAHAPDFGEEVELNRPWPRSRD